MDSAGLVSQQKCLCVNKQCNFVLTERHLAIFDFCCEVSSNINQQFVFKRAKWSRSKKSKQILQWNSILSLLCKQES